MIGLVCCLVQFQATVVGNIYNFLIIGGIISVSRQLDRWCTGCVVWKKVGRRLEVRERSQMGREVGLCGGIGGHGRVFLLGQ